MPEAIDELIELGYCLVDEGLVAPAVDVWLVCWDSVRQWLPATPFDLDEEARHGRELSVALAVWIEDVELWTRCAALESPAYWAKLQAFCEESLALLSARDRGHTLLMQAFALSNLRRRSYDARRALVADLREVCAS